MRSRRTTFSTSIDFNKPIDTLVDELQSHLEPNSSTHQLGDRIETLKNFLVRFKFHFNRTLPSSNRTVISEGAATTAISTEQEFESALQKCHESICIGLVYNVIQMESSQLRLLSLQTILMLSHFETFARRFHELHINAYIVRLIDLDFSWDDTSLCIEFIRQLTQLWPSRLDKAIVFCLLSALEDYRFRLNFLILETLLEIVCRRPLLASECSVFNELVTYVLNACTDNEFVIEMIMQTLIRVCDEQQVRQKIPLYDLLCNLVAPIIDTAYVPFRYGSFHAQHKLTHLQSQLVNNNANPNSALYSTAVDLNNEPPDPKAENVITAAYTALASLMTSYNGVMCFLVNNGRLVFSLLSPLSWYLEANKRESDKRQALAEQITATSLRDSDNVLENNVNNNNNSGRKASDPKELAAKQRELYILNGLVSFFYKIFDIEEISIKRLKAKAFRCLGRSMSVGSSYNHYQFTPELIEDDLVNQECESLFEPFENYSTQSNLNNLEATNGRVNKYTSTSPNLAMCHKVFLLKTFIEARLFEGLIDLYFGLPVSFMENCSFFGTNQSGASSNTNNLLAQYELLSLKCLHLFAELYYMSNKLLHNEYCIDDLDPDVTKCPFTSNSSKSIYNEMKKLSLIAYLKHLNYLEREKELIIYVTDLNTKKESIRRGEMLPSDEIAHMSFYAQQFLANSGHLSSKKYQQELEILNSTLSISSMSKRDDRRGSQDGAALFSYMSRMVTNLIVNEESPQTKEKKELKGRVADLEKRLEDQIDATQVLQTDAHTATINWKWLEIIRLFELFLLDRSSLYPNFAPTQDAELFQHCKRKLLTESQKLVKFLKKLYDFFSLTVDTAYNSAHTSQTSSMPILTSQMSQSPRTAYLTSPSFMTPRVSQTQINASSSSSMAVLSDQIACTGCYLIDFSLDELRVENVAQNQFASVIEFVFVQFLGNVRQQLLNEFPLNNSSGTTLTTPSTLASSFSSSRVSMSQTSTVSARSSLSKESILANYVLLLGHISANSKGDLLLEHFKIYDLLVKIIETHHDVALIKLIVSVFNFYTSPKSRMILERALCSHPPRASHISYNELKIYILKLILNLFRAHNLKFEAFFVRIVFKCMAWTLDPDATSPELTPSMRFSDEQVLELAINSIEYFFHLRPDLLDSVCGAHDQDELIKIVDEVAIKCGLVVNMTRARLLRTKLEFLSFRLKMCDVRMNKMSRAQVENMLQAWYASRKHVRHFQLVERHLFDANLVNANYVNEMDDRAEYNIYDRPYDWIPTPMTQQSTFASFSLDDSSPLNRSRSNTWNNNNPSSSGAQQQPGVKLYRRINDSNRNFARFQASLAQIVMPFHINTALVRYSAFVENNFVLNDFLDEKTGEQLRVIKSVAKGEISINYKKLKSAIWSVSALCICEDGLRFVSRVSQKYGIFSNLFEFVSFFIKLAEEHSSLSIRATCYLCANLLCKSSTGANLFGKLGWHTFQSNLFTPTRAFQGMMSSLSSEQQDLTVASFVDIAVVIYNLNRNKLAGIVELKPIHKYYLNEFTNYELKFLHEISRTDLSTKLDVDLMRAYNHNQQAGPGGGVYFAENLTVPVRMTLLSPDDDFSTRPELFSNESSMTDEFKCSEVNCFYCCALKRQGGGLGETRNDDSDDAKRRDLALDLISKFLFMINVDKLKLKKIISLRKYHPNVFNFCFFYLVFTRYLSSYRLKFHVRKCVQELFSDVFRIYPIPNL